MPEAYDKLRAHLRDAATLASIAALLGWDQETYLPPRGVAARSDQQAAIASLVHTRSASNERGDLIAACENDQEVMADEDLAANVRLARRDYDRARRLPDELVVALARDGALAQEAWKHARARSDFESFRPQLENMITLSQRKADCLSDAETAERYDALLDGYEPDTKAADIERLFAPLKTELTELLDDIRSNGKSPSATPLHVRIPPRRQHKLGEAVVEALGFDLNAGRLDTTTHPFCSGMAPGDTRLTTRYRDEHFTDALYSTMHECGHGLYEQGLLKQDRFGEPVAEAVSLGVHESQSRLWENFVGRSQAFWKWALPLANRKTKGRLRGFKPKDLFRAVNRAEPSLVRVEADEATYNQHVMVRFEIERALIAGDLKVADVPGVWNESYERYLGVKVPDDARGCLQDVHWSFGLVGYFPTYTLGNIYAAQLWDAVRADIPDLEQGFAKGEFGVLLSWMRERIHVHGRRYPAPELIHRATGQPLDAKPLLRHLRERLSASHGLS